MSAELVKEELLDDQSQQYYKRKRRRAILLGDDVRSVSSERLKSRTPNKPRRSARDAQRLFQDYFADNAVFSAADFRRRFRMKRELFQKIHDQVIGSNDYFIQKADALGVLGLTSYQKMTAALRMLSYGCPADALDENLRLGESTALRCLKEFCKTIIDVFGETYVRAPNEEDLLRILKTNSARGFPGMLGSIDCMHWNWKNCPKAWAGQYKGKEEGPTVVLEAIASYDLWIWHAYFGMPGSNNDINVLDRSPLFSSLVQGKSPACQYLVNGREYNQGYYLADGIYPTWAVFVKTISQPMTQKHKLFAKAQESARKDIERAFGVLQARFQIIDKPCKLWHTDAMKEVLVACIIMHNMIVENERDDYRLTNQYLFEDASRHKIQLAQASVIPATLIQMRHRMQSVTDANHHNRLTRDLIEHIWNEHGNTV